MVKKIEIKNENNLNSNKTKNCEISCFRGKKRKYLMTPFETKTHRSIWKSALKAKIYYNENELGIQHMKTVCPVCGSQIIMRIETKKLKLLKFISYYTIISYILSFFITLIIILTNSEYIEILLPSLTNISYLDIFLVLTFYSSPLLLYSWIIIPLSKNKEKYLKYFNLLIETENHKVQPFSWSSDPLKILGFFMNMNDSLLLSAVYD